MAIVQARTSSSRLPGKVLKPLAGEPMILRQLERIARARTLDEIVVATSNRQEDDELAELLIANGAQVVRGPLEDVLGRFVQVMDAYEPEVVVRLTADCPLISPVVIDQVVTAFHQTSADYLSNTMDPTYPDGLDVEVVTSDALRWVDHNSQDVPEREHVTLGVYRRPERFVIENFADPSGANRGELRWTVDNADDLAFVEKVYEHLLERDPEFDYPEVLALIAEHRELSRSAADSARNAALDGLDTGAMKHPGNAGAP